MSSLLKEFKEFINRGNVMDMAVGVIVGGAFTSVVNALVKNVITPLIGAIGGSKEIKGLSIVLNGQTIDFGAFVGAVISFLITAAVVFFLVKALNNAQKLKKVIPGIKDTDPEAEKPAPAPRTCPYCKQEIADEATRCPHCTSVLPGFTGER